MRVFNSGPVGPSSTRKTDKKQAADGSFGRLLEEAGGADSSAEASSVRSFLPLGGIFAAQTVEDEPQKRKKQQAIAQAENVLDALEDVRLDMLAGQISPVAAQRLAQRAAQQLEAADDPRLKAILEEIELRAQVELAKLGRSNY